MYLEREQSRLLVVGPPMWRFGDRPAAGDAYGLIELPPAGAAVNTTLLEFGVLTGSPYVALEWRGPVLVEGNLSGAPFEDLKTARELAAVQRAVAGDGTAPWVPLFIVCRTGDAEVTAHSQIRFGGPDALFLRTGLASAGDSGGRALVEGAVQRAIELHEENRTFLNNHQCYLRKFWPDDEIEYKLTLEGPVDIFDLAVAFRNLVGAPPLEGYLWEYRDDFQQWEFDNHLYEVLGPEDEVGYVSFIPDSLGTVVVKRKWFAEDAVRRRESRWRGVEIGAGGYEDHVRGLGVDAVYRGSFRRTRFDVTYESVATGNVHSIMFDRCHPLDRKGPDLYQVEIEYLHSRTLNPASVDCVEAELKFLLEYAKERLTAFGVRYAEGQLSKLTYLRGLDN